MNGNVTPRFKHCNGSCPNPGAVVFFDPLGIGLWIHQDSMAYLPSISRLDMKPDEWLPVNVTPAELPAFIKGRA
ncbi:hypothetical protein SSCG_06075 [Streptomyces clavuligerus]|nr:hypothetical protein SSCG_06075 [Streptomyces clavuligerus]